MKIPRERVLREIIPLPSVINTAIYQALHETDHLIFYPHNKFIRWMRKLKLD